MYRALPVILALIVAGMGAAPATEQPRVTDPRLLAELREIFRPEAYLRAEDRSRARSLRSGFYGPFPCTFVTFERGLTLENSLPTDQCFKMTQPQRWKGLWRNEFEGSEFCPGPVHECPSSTTRYGIWLTIKEGLPQYDLQGRGGLYAVDFVGRRTLYPGMQGHMGMSRYEIIVDRMLSMKELEAPPPPPTEAEMRAWDKECEAAENCFTNEELKKLGWNRK